MLAVIRQLPNHVSIFAIIGVEILDARKRRLCDVGVISTDAEKKSQAVKGRFKKGPSHARQNQNRFQNASRFEVAEKRKIER